MAQISECKSSVRESSLANFCSDCGEKVETEQKFCSSCGQSLSGERREASGPKNISETNPNLKSDPNYKCPKCGGKHFYMGWKPASVQTGILDTDTQARFCGTCDVQMTWSNAGIQENRKMALYFVIFVAVGAAVMIFVLNQILVF